MLHRYHMAYEWQAFSALYHLILTCTHVDQLKRSVVCTVMQATNDCRHRVASRQTPGGVGGQLPNKHQVPPGGQPTNTRWRRWLATNILPSFSGGCGATDGCKLFEWDCRHRIRKIQTGSQQSSLEAPATCNFPHLLTLQQQLHVTVTLILFRQ